LSYAIVAKPRVFHILWNNKIEFFDRTLLMLYYRMLGRKVVLTAHNVNAAKRDGRDSALNRLTLRVQYVLANHLFVHTQKMRDELLSEFRVPSLKVSVIPFGINNSIPTTSLTRAEAKHRLGLQQDEVAALFFGQIAPYKGLEYLVSALPEILTQDSSFRLIIAGKVKKGCEQYWETVRQTLGVKGLASRITMRIEHVPDAEVEVYFKAADVLVIPYTQIFQSGVPFLAYSFGVPVIATDVGSLREDIVEGKTGFISLPRNPDDIARAVRRFRSSDLFQNPESARAAIRTFANDRYSWSRVAEATEAVYREVLAAT
jgi:glycosyltransferase involved in cell wall biosynthesis